MMMRRNQIFRSVLALTLWAAAVSVAGAATFDSGSTGVNQAFPTNPPAQPYNGIVLDLQSGNVRYYYGLTLVSTVPVPGQSGGFPNGILNFTTVEVPVGKTLKFIRNASNTPVVFLAQTDVTIAGTINVEGQAGASSYRSVNGPTIFPSGGAAGPGGFDGGAGGGNPSFVAGTGLGPGGGAGGSDWPCAGGGGGFARPGRDAGVCGTAGGPTYGNPQFLPLVGGSGGGGGGAPGSGTTGGGGGGGGGAILIAASGTITLTGTITARGGDGGYGNPSFPYGNYGGGGSGGGVRLVATRLAGSSGSILVDGGLGRYEHNTGTGGAGRVRLEAYTNTLRADIGWVNPSLDTPRSVFPPSSPVLRITSVGGQTVPATPTGSFGAPDVTLPVGTSSPATIVVTATNVPEGTTVILRAKPLTGAVTSVTTPGLSGGTAQANLPLEDLTQPNVISAEATFTLGAWLDSPIKYAGEDVTTATVIASLGGPSTIRYFTTSGREVPEHAVLGLGLPR